MTTSWALASRGRWAAAAASNGAGLLLFAATVVGSAAALAATVTGRGPAIERPFELTAACGGALLLTAVLDWIRRLAG